MCVGGGGGCIAFRQKLEEGVFSKITWPILILKLFIVITLIAIKVPGECAYVSELVRHNAIYGHRYITRSAHARVQSPMPNACADSANRPNT